MIGTEIVLKKAQTTLRKLWPYLTSKKAWPPPRRSRTTGLDLYLWLTYRTFGLTRPLRLTWPQLYRQFGEDPARAGARRTVDSFRTKCLRELQKIQRAWPNLHYRTVKGGLVVLPSPPAIAPSQLRLVDAG